MRRLEGGVKNMISKKLRILCFKIMLCFESRPAAGGVSPGRKPYGLSASALSHGAEMGAETLQNFYI